MHAGVESVRILEVVEQGLDLARWDEGGLTTDLAHQMLVVVVDRQMPPTRLAPEVHVMHQPEPGELVERAVGRRRIDRSAVLGDVGEDLGDGQELFTPRRQNGADGPSGKRETESTFTDLLVDGRLE